MSNKLYKIENDKITRLKKTCPRCGAGTYMADHKDRISCGHCGYTEMKKGN
jgi:small subunit ribosomal protein S27Ae